MTISNFPFDSESGLTFDPTKMLVAGGKLGLNLIDNPGQHFLNPFDSDVGHTYDSAKLEFVGGKLQQKDQRPAAGMAYANYETNKDLNWGRGTFTGTLGGNASVHDGYLDLNTGGYIEYPVNNFVGMTGSAGCIRKRISFGYTGAAATTQYIIQTSPSIAARVYLVHNSTFIQCYITNTAGTTIYSMTFSWTPSSTSTIYEFEVNWTSTNAYVFINGVKQDEDTGSLGMIAPTLFRIGGDANTKLKIYDLIVYNTLQHSSNYTPSWTGIPNAAYADAYDDFPLWEYYGAGELQSVDMPVVVTQGNEKWVLGGYYWNGSVWAVSNKTYAQASIMADNFANLWTLLDIVGIEQIVNTIVFPPGNTQGYMDVEYVGQIYPTDNPKAEIDLTWYIEALIDFDETATKTGSDEIKYILKKDGTKYWFNVGVLEESDGTYSQSNTAAEILAVIDQFTTARVLFGVDIFLHSDDGLTMPELDLLSIEYDFAGGVADAIEKCIVWGVAKDNEGNANTDPIKIFLSKDAVKYKTGTMLLQRVVSVTPDSTGYWEAELVETENMETGIHYVFQMDGISYFKDVPNEATKNFNDLEDYYAST